MTIDLTFLEFIVVQSPWANFWFIFSKGGWVVFIFVFLWIAWQLWVIRKQNEYAASINYILLAIDVPKENVQSPKAVEQIFSHLTGIHSERSWVEKNLRGSFQESFSLELISLDGYIQFLIRTPDKFRDVVEAAVYSQYPEAEIVEVADYTENLPKELPNEEYDLWGTELTLANDNIYPIRTYPAFEHPLSQEFKDPLGSLLEALGRLGKGEQLWIQYIITPINNDWAKRGEKIIKEIMDKAAGKEPPKKESLIDYIIKLPLEIIEGTRRTFSDILRGGFGLPLEATSEAKSATAEAVIAPPFPPPKEKGAAEAIQAKISKAGFEVKFRVLYLGRREVFTKARGVNGFLGGIKQFNSLDLNALKPVGTVTTNGNILWNLYDWQRKKLWRQRKVLRAYRRRSTKIGPKPFILNIEELASLWHFPTEVVKAPLIKKTEAKRAEPPFALPVEKEIAKEAMTEEEKSMKKAGASVSIKTDMPAKVSAKAEPPENLPIFSETES